MPYLANLSGATHAGVEGGGAPVARAPDTLVAAHLSLLSAVWEQLTAHLGGLQLVMDNCVNHLLAVLVHKLLALVRDGPREVTAHELNNPFHLKLRFTDIVN